MILVFVGFFLYLFCFVSTIILLLDSRVVKPSSRKCREEIYRTMDRRISGKSVGPGRHGAVKATSIKVARPNVPSIFIQCQI